MIFEVEKTIEKLREAVKEISPSIIIESDFYSTSRHGEYKSLCFLDSNRGRINLKCSVEIYKDNIYLYMPMTNSDEISSFDEVVLLLKKHIKYKNFA